MEAGNLIRITRRPTDDPRAQETTFWCERAGMSMPLQIGSVGLEWGREHIQVIEGFIRDLSAQRKSAKVWKQKYSELMRMQETYIKRLQALEAGEEKE